MSDLKKLKTNIMKKTAFRILIFVLIIIAILAINLYTFRSDYPMLWFITCLGSVISLILFPFKTFFNIKQN